MPDAGVVAAVLAGLTGSLHCVAMCGGYVVASHARVQPLVPAARLRAGLAAAHLGRLSMYLLLGFAFGAAGGAAFAFAWPAAQRVLYAVANGVLLLIAVRIAYPAASGVALERAGLALFQRAAPLAQPWLRGTGMRARFVLGLLWGLTPCALIYGMLPLALLAGSAGRGAAVMAGLWAGTLPALLLATGLARRLATPANRRLAGLAIAVLALIGVARALAGPNALASGPFCLLP